MSTTPSISPCTPSNQPLAPYISQICGTSPTPPATPPRPKRPNPHPDDLAYECNQTGDDHRDNKLTFFKLITLASRLAQILQQLPSDYYHTWTPYSSRVSDATRLLRQDTRKYRARISGGTPYCAKADPVKRNTIIRALTLFFLGGIHAAQYLEHDTDSRVAWIIQLNMSACWIKSNWERDMSRQMICLMKQRVGDIRLICRLEVVSSVVFNSYFLMLFARRDCEDLKAEMRSMGVESFSWYEISVHRKAFFLKSRE
jgi:hypothetical protein